MPFKWRFADGPMLAHFYFLTGNTLHLTMRLKTGSFCCILQEDQCIGSNKVLDKSIAANVHGSNFANFYFLKMTTLWKSVESQEIYHSIIL